ncbi:hypothetical protein [Gemmiger formicilis]|uniref:hypothetical protein n=1 Tax=Gemmiger formicilis TaxID=745368 RepID=UPI003996598D
MKARTYKKLLRLNQDEQERLRYLSKSTGLNQEQVLRKVLMDAPLLERPQFVKEYSPKSLRNREGFWYNRRKPPREAPSWKSTPKTPAAKQWLLT